MGACTSICVCSSYLPAGTGPFPQELRPGYPLRSIRWSLSRLALRLLSKPVRYRSDNHTLAHHPGADNPHFGSYPPHNERGWNLSTEPFASVPRVAPPPEDIHQNPRIFRRERLLCRRRAPERCLRLVVRIALAWIAAPVAWNHSPYAPNRLREHVSLQLIL